MGEEGWTGVVAVIWERSERMMVGKRGWGLWCVGDGGRGSLMVQEVRGFIVHDALGFVEMIGIGMND